MSGVYVGGSYTGATVRQFDTDGNTNWSVNPGTSVCTADGSGNLYAAAASGVVKKYDVDGNEIWSRTYHTATIRSIAVDADDNVFVCGDGASSQTHSKWDASGTKVWDKNHGNTLYAVAVDADGNSFFGGTVSSSVSIRSYAPDGTAGWTANHAAAVNAITTDADGAVYIGGDRNASNLTHRKYDADGTLAWSKDHGAIVRACCVDNNGYIYFAGNRTSNLTTRQYSSDGTLNWSRDYHGSAVYSISIDVDGNAYVCGSRTSSISARKYNSSGTQQWTADCGLTATHIKHFVSPITTDIPALLIDISLGTPGAGFYIVAPGLAIPLSLATPTASEPPEPPIISGQVIYRCYIGLPSGQLSEYQMTSLQCRRRRNDSTWLTVRLAVIDIIQAENIELLVGYPVVIYSGNKSGDGSENLGEFLRANLEQVDYTQTPASVVVDLTCRVDAVNETLQTRPLTGVVGYQNDNGRVLLRCTDIQHRLRPGDTVTYGSLSFVAYNVQYGIEYSGQWMTVQEEE